MAKHFGIPRGNDGWFPGHLLKELTVWKQMNLKAWLKTTYVFISSSFRSRMFDLNKKEVNKPYRGGEKSGLHLLSCCFFFFSFLNRKSSWLFQTIFMVCLWMESIRMTTIDSVQLWYLLSLLVAWNQKKSIGDFPPCVIHYS